MEKTKKFQLVELLVPSTTGVGQRVYFQDQPQLRSQSGRMIFIQSIETYAQPAVTVSPFSGVQAPFPVDLQSAYLVLNVAGFEDVQLVPLAVLNRIEADQANYVANIRELFGLDDLYRVDWTKSYVQFSAAPSGTVAFLFGVRYRETLAAGASTL